MSASVFVSGLPATPAPEFFWAVLTWIIIPGGLLIWAAYQSRRGRMRRVYLKLRQLEIRLAAGTPKFLTDCPATSRTSASASPSSLTTRILLPPSEAMSPIPVYQRRLPG